MIGFATWKYKLFALDIASASEEIVRAMPSALILIGPDETVLRVNQAASELLGTPVDTLVGADFLSLFPEKMRRSVGQPPANQRDLLHRVGVVQQLFFASSALINVDGGKHSLKY